VSVAVSLASTVPLPFWTSKVASTVTSVAREPLSGVRLSAASAQQRPAVHRAITRL
jgi:hypothetical protein